MSLPSNQQFPYNYIFEQSQHSNVNLQQLFPSTQPMLYQIPQEFQTNQNPQLKQLTIIEILQNLNYQNITSSTNSLNQISELSKLLDAILMDDKQPKENKKSVKTRQGEFYEKEICRYRRGQHGEIDNLGNFLGKHSRFILSPLR